MSACERERGEEREGGKRTSALWEEPPDRTRGRQLRSRDRNEGFTVPSLSETAPGV